MSSGEAKKTRPELLLSHIARHGLTVRAIASRLYCESSESKTENLFGKLLRQKRIVAFNLSKQPRLSYYRLAAAEAASRGLPATGGRLSGRVAHEAIALLYFCHGGPTKRRKVPAKLIQERVGFPLRTLNAPFVAQELPEPYFGRVIVPGREARPDYALKIILSETLFWLRFPEAEVWLAEGALRFIVLTYSSARTTLFREAIAAARSRNRIPTEVRIDVEQVVDLLRPRPTSEVEE